MVVFSSPLPIAATTLQLIGTGTGTAPIYTLGDGVVTSSALSCIAPKVRKYELPDATFLLLLYRPPLFS
jgi:hypothetical protein